VFKHGPGNAKSVNSGAVCLVETVVKDFLYDIEICFHFEFILYASSVPGKPLGTELDLLA
jgi:hypothetical protein